MRSDFWSGVVGAAGPAVRTLSYVKGSGPLSQRALPGSNMAEVHKLRAIGINREIRALAVRRADDIVWFYIGPHDGYERQL